MKKCAFMIMSHSVLLRMRNVLDRSCRENHNTHFVFNNGLPKIVPFLDNVEKYDTAREATQRQGSMAHEQCMLDD
jgi:hypothetical protein